MLLFSSSQTNQPTNTHIYLYNMACRLNTTRLDSTRSRYYFLAMQERYSQYYKLCRQNELIAVTCSSKYFLIIFMKLSVCHHYVVCFVISSALTFSRVFGFTPCFFFVFFFFGYFYYFSLALVFLPHLDFPHFLHIYFHPTNAVGTCFLPLDILCKMPLNGVWMQRYETEKTTKRRASKQM